MTDNELDELADIARLVAGDQWAAGDWLAKRFPESKYPRKNANTGLHKDLEQLSVNAAKYVGVEVKPDVLRQLRATAIAWPDGARAPSVSFRVHSRLRGKADREEVIGEIVRWAKRRDIAMVHARHFDTYRAEHNPRPKHLRPVSERLELSIGAAVRRLFLEGVVPRPDWWNSTRLTEGERRAIGDVLEHLAGEVRSTI